MRHIFAILIALTLLIGNAVAGVPTTAAEDNGAVTSTDLIRVEECFDVPDFGFHVCVDIRGVAHSTQTSSGRMIIQQNLQRECQTVTDIETGALISSQCSSSVHSLDHTSPDGSLVTRVSFDSVIVNVGESGTLTCTVTVRFHSVDGHVQYDVGEAACEFEPA